MTVPSNEHNSGVSYNTNYAFISNNWVHHNVYGLWNDYSCSNCSYVRNLVELNERVGIFVEDSQFVTIRKNILQNNGVK